LHFLFKTIAFKIIFPSFCALSFYFCSFVCRVASLSPKGITIGEENASTPPCNWVDFGTASLTLNLLLDSPKEERISTPDDAFGSQSQPDNDNNHANNGSAPAIEEIFYSDMTSAKIAVHKNGTATLTISVPKLSQDLLDAVYGNASEDDDVHRISITFVSDDVVDMVRAAPLVVNAMEGAGISLSSVRGGGGNGGGDGSNGEADMSQRPKKVSM
jgi:hypothetical protein